MIHPFPFEHPAESCYTFTKEADGKDGVRWVFIFANGLGASIIQDTFSYGYEDGLWELAVINHEGGLIYSTPITDDVIGYQTEQQIAVLLDQICRLGPGPWPTERDGEES